LVTLFVRAFILAIKTVVKNNSTTTINIKHITFFSDSTRPLYQKKLASVLAGDNGAEEANDTNGEIEEEEEEVAPTKAASRRVSTRSTRSNIAAAAEFSADEEEAILEEEPVASEATEDDDSDEQPSVVVKEATPKPASNKSPLQALGQTIRQRFSGPSTTEQKSDRFTPTPRYVVNFSNILLKIKNKG
jgi:hypothetical protein